MNTFIVILGIALLVFLGVKMTKKNSVPQGPVNGTPGVDQPTNPEEPMI